MDLIVISPPYQNTRELSTVQALVVNGLETYHLRKPGLSEAELTHWLEQAPEPVVSRTVLHSHHHLVNRFPVKGVHGPWALIEPFSEFDNLTTSTSTHNFDEVERGEKSFDYLFFGPIFPSISKSDYHPEFSYELISSVMKGRSILNNEPGSGRVYALGGIHPGNVEGIAETGFDGAALLGCIWNCPPEEGLNNFKIIKESLWLMTAS